MSLFMKGEFQVKEILEGTFPRKEFFCPLLLYYFLGIADDFFFKGLFCD